MENTNKLTISISGPTKSGKTMLAALVTWTLMKFNQRPSYVGDDRAKWMQLAGDELSLSQQFAALVNKGLTLFEIQEQNEPHLTELTQKYDLLLKDNEALRAELEQIKNEIIAPAPKIEQDPL